MKSTPNDQFPYREDARGTTSVCFRLVLLKQRAGRKRLNRFLTVNQLRGAEGAFISRLNPRDSSYRDGRGGLVAINGFSSVLHISP